MNRIDTFDGERSRAHIAARKIVVDGVFFKLGNTGIARTWREVLSRWQQTAFGPRVVAIDRDGSLPVFERIETVRLPMFEPSGWEADRLTVQTVCDKLGACLFISTYYTRPERTPSLMMLYDMIPELVEGFDLSVPVWRQKHDAIRHAIGYAANSRNTLADLRRLFPQSAAKPASVVSRGVSTVFAPPTREELQDFHARMVAPHLGGRRFLLYVGILSNYKNAALLLDAFAGMEPLLRERYAVLFTSPEPTVESFRSLPGLIAHAAKLSDADLRLAYAAAECLVYPSLYEGFGLPPIEAMACGCPVICSGTASMPEVVGDAALIIDPRKVHDLTAALERLGDPTLVEDLRRRGLERAKRFTWEDTAARLAAFLTQCADRVPAVSVA